MNNGLTTTKQPTDIAGLLEANRNALLQALPKSIKIDRFLRVAMNAIARNPDLQKCTASSLFGAIMQSAQFGLEVGLMNQAHLVPYWNSEKRSFEAQFQIGYLGLRDMAEWYGDVDDGDAQVVYELDEFDYELGDTPSIHHKPAKGQSRGDVAYYYAWAKPKNGKIKVAVMSRQEVEEHRDKFVRKTKQGDYSPAWTKSFDAMGIKTVMTTGDNPPTPAAIAAEAGVDDFLAQATPETKLKLIREYQTGGRLVAMTGDGTNDAPALAQADVAVAMNTGTQPAREAANMVDLDSNPTKLIEIVEIGKQLLMTRGALTTFSLANDVSKYFAIIPAAFASTYPILNTLNIMRLATPQSAILSAVIFNALIIIALIPLALRGVPYRAVGAAQLLRDNLLIYGLGGLLVPFIGIKLIDMLLVALGLS